MHKDYYLMLVCMYWYVRRYVMKEGGSMYEMYFYWVCECILFMYLWSIIMKSLSRYIFSECNCIRCRPWWSTIFNGSFSMPSYLAVPNCGKKSQSETNKIQKKKQKKQTLRHRCRWLTWNINAYCLHPLLFLKS